MAGFVYFLPGVGNLNERQRGELGLGHAFPDGSPVVMQNHFEDGTRGVFQFHRRDAEVYGKLHRLQDVALSWRRVKAAEGCRVPWWGLGWVMGKLPGPEDLVRVDRRVDIEYVHPDAHWMIPGQKAIPRELRLDGTGVFRERVEPMYRELAEDAQEVFTLVMTGQDAMQALSTERQCEICLRALRSVYRIGRYEADTMGLLTERTRYMILMCLIDKPTLDAEPTEREAALEAKKKELSGLWFEAGWER